MVHEMIGTDMVFIWF